MDPEELARSWGLHVVDGPEITRLSGRVLRVNRRLSHEERRFDIAHELGHHLCERAGYGDSEKLADYVGAALLMPNAEMRVAMRETACDLPQLRERFLVSWDALMQRVPEVMSSVATIVDGGRISFRSRSSWLTGRRFRKRTMHSWERELVDHVAETEEHLVDGGVSAWWAGDGRVCMLAEVGAWEGRTWEAST